MVMKGLTKIVVFISIGFHVITAYCHCDICTGGSVITADGSHVEEGWTIAGPRNLPLGTIVEVDGHVYELQDRTAKRFDGRFDIYFESHQEALNFGIQKKDVKILCLVTEQGYLPPSTLRPLIADR